MNKHLENYVLTLDKLYDELYNKYPEYLKNDNLKIAYPKLGRISIKTIWSNFNDTCESINRDSNHLACFVSNELNTDFSLDNKNNIIMKGIYNQQQITSILSKYMKEYVICGICKSYSTCIDKDKVTRINYITCTKCRSKRAIQSIDTGFRAVKRGERRKLKQ